MYDTDLENDKTGLLDEINEHIYLSTHTENLLNCNYTQLPHIKPSRPNECKIISYNIRSLKKHIDKLNDINHQLTKFDIVCVNETSTATEDLPFGISELTIDGFHTPIVQNPIRNSAKGGGLAIYVNQKFVKTETSIKILNSLCAHDKIEEGEHLYIEIDTGQNKKNVVIGNMYRSPSTPPEKFIQKVTSNLEILKKHDNKFIAIVGDSNIDMLQHNIYEPATTLFDTYTEHAFAPVISRPTRITTSTATLILIDHIFVNNPHRVSNSAVFTLDISDHLATSVTLLFDEHTQHKQAQDTAADANFAQINKENLEKFRAILTELDWSKIDEQQSSDEKFNVFLQMYNNCYNEVFIKDTI